MVHSAQDQGWEGSLHLVPSLSTSCAEITAHAITSAVEERQEKRTKTLAGYSDHHATEQGR